MKVKAFPISTFRGNIISIITWRIWKKSSTRYSICLILLKEKKISRKRINLPYFKDIVAQVYDKTSSNYAMITSDTSFKQYCFDVYLCLYNNIGYNKLNREDMRDSYIYQLDEAIENMKMDIPNEISKIVHDIFKKQIDEKEKNKKNDSDEKVGMIYSRNALKS